MKAPRIRYLLSTALTLTAITLTLSLSASAQTETILHSFAGGPGGADPSSALIFDPVGNLYGVTHDGGHIGGRDCGGCGVVFELSPTVSGGWKETVLSAFTWFNGAYPQAGLVRDVAGNLYGTASDGGYLCSCGVVFELSPTSTGAWKQSVLHSFHQGSDGFFPSSPLTLDAAGNLYGTASYGGSTSAACSYGCGVVFMLSTGSGGKWQEKVLHTFAGSDGANPSSGVIFDAAGNLYGETYGGGPGGQGVVFKLSPTSSGPWTETILHGFDTSNPVPSGGLIFDQAGNMYGTTQGGVNVGGCSSACGSAFNLSPNSDGTWTEKTLYAFTGGDDGAFPSGLAFDSSGNLYGAAPWGGGYNRGVVFKLTSTAGGNWTLSVLYYFPGGLNGAELPGSSLTLDSAGNLYGTALGGPGGLGVVYKITP